MDAQVLEIDEKVAPVEFFPSVPTNFRTTDGPTVPAAATLGPHVELYCLDDENRRALFVQTGPDVDLLDAPFFYLAQYRGAERLLALPYEALHALADDLPDPRLVFLFSTGRCGSTLLSRAFNAVPGVRSLSEPDVYSDVATLRHWDPSREDEYARLLRSCTRILGRNADTLAIKFRGGAIHAADLLHREFPAARTLFLYRNAERWLESMHAGFTPGLPGEEAAPTFLRYLLAQSPLIVPFAQRHAREATVAEAYALTWLSVLDRYVTLTRAGVEMLPVRYEDLTADPAGSVHAVLDWCDLPTDVVDKVVETFATDSQTGTALSREARAAAAPSAPTPEDHAALRAVLAEHPVVNTPDFDARSLSAP